MGKFKWEEGDLVEVTPPKAAKKKAAKKKAPKK